jgi:hypothetical protein
MMWTFKNVVAVGLFVFGSTFLWMTPAFAGRTPPPTGMAWTLVNILALVAVVGFTVAAWTVFQQYPWWGSVRLVSAVIGLVAVIPQPVDAPGGQRHRGRRRAATRHPRLGRPPALIRRAATRRRRAPEGGQR